MATSLSSVLAVAALVQIPAASDSLAARRARLGRDSTDASAWALVGRGYLRLADDAHGTPHRPPQDSAWVRALLDSADQALERAATLSGPPGASAAGDSARVLRVGGWTRRARLAWETGGIGAGPQSWGPIPTDLRVPPVLEELGENLLRACPMSGVLLTAGDADSYAAWYMRFARGLRPDLLVVPLAAWRSDATLRRRLAADLRLGRHDGGDGWIADLVKRRPVCVSMAFERPPEPATRVRWAARPLLWVAGPEPKGERVPPRDFVFAALRIALERGDAWAAPALAVYARAARTTPALCEPLGTFKVASEVATCRR
jgi:hypothetical protein